MFDNVLVEILKKGGSTEFSNSSDDEVLDKGTMLVSLEFNNSKEDEDRKIENYKHNYLNNSKYKKFYLINMNLYMREDEDKLLVKKNQKDEETGQILEIYDVNLSSLLDKDCETFERGSLEYMLYWVICNDERELRQFYKNDEKMLKVVDEIAKVTNGFNQDFYNTID